MRRLPRAGAQGPLGPPRELEAMVERLNRACRSAPTGDPPALPSGYAALDAHSTGAGPGDALCRLVLPVLDEFASQLPEAHVLSFVDADGFVRWMGGDAPALAQLAVTGLRPGARCPAEAEPDGGGAAERPPLELVGPAPRRPLAPAWSCSAAAVMTPDGAPFGLVHLAARGALEQVGAGAIARAVEERLRSARSVRDHVIAYALRAAPPGEALVALDENGETIDASSAGRRWIEPDAGDLAAYLAGWLRSARDRLEGETTLTPAGASGPRLLVSPLRYERVLVGAIVRVVGGSHRPSAGARPLPAAPGARYGLEQILGGSPAVLAATELARTAARNDLPVVLHGESGTGKELFAQAIHALSARAAGPFVAVNCGSIPPSLLEAELFGYEPGTFTGGRRDGNAGKFEKASGGTIFLDEIGELPSPAQAALLRVLQEREVVRLGGSVPRALDLRVVAATNRSLADDVRACQFRADLYFRLHVLPIHIPPLRERTADVAILAAAFLREAETEIGRHGLALGESALAALAAYPWPGNVRELRNVILRTAATTEGPTIEGRDLPEEVRGGAHPLDVEPAPARHHGAPERVQNREELLRALEASSWNVARTAAALQVSRMTLYRWLHKHGIAR